MPYPRVYVRVTFVSTKVGSKPPINIDSPMDMSEILGDITSNEYDRLKSRLFEIVEESEHQLFFHKDNAHRYKFDESALQKGAVYGMKDRRKKDGSEANRKLTARNLVAIESASEFQKHLENVSEVAYQRRGRNNRLKKVDSYRVDLCVVLIREKEKKAAPATTIVCNSNGADGTIATSGSGGGTKRKGAPLPFSFPASKIGISLYAPIETQQKRDTAKTGVPSGKTIKEFVYDLTPFISGKYSTNDDLSFGPSLDEEGEAVGEDFIADFTLSHFRKDLMGIARDDFAEEYGVAKKSLGRKCKLYVQKQWNSSAWTELPTTETFLRTLREQMTTKSRVKNSVVLLRFSFGRAKAGTEFQTEREMNDYVCKDFGDGIGFSQNEVPASPYIRQVGAIKRDECWNKPARISELIVSLYKNKEGKLFHGFVKEHGNSFFRIVSADLSIRKNASIYLPTLNDPSNHPFSDEMIDTHLLSFFMRSHMNDLPGSPLPETGKFPPTNISMMEIPPTLREWKQTQQQQQVQGYHVTPPPPFNPHQLHTSSSVRISNSEACGGDIMTITFRAEWDEELETSVIIEDSLSSSSTMDSVMAEGEVLDDLGVSADTIVDYKFLIKKKTGSTVTLKWKRYKKLTVDTLIRINNVDTDYVIILKRSV